MKARTILEGCGLGIIATLPYIWIPFSPYHSGLYHSRFPTNNVAWGALIDIAVVSALAVLLFAYLEKKGTPYRSLIWALVAARLVSVVVQFYAIWSGNANPGYFTGKVYFCATLAIALALRWIRPPSYEVAAKGLAVLLSLAGFCVIWIVPELVYQGLLPRRSDPPVIAKSFPPGSVNPAAAGKRIVWILFDELSYAQTFEQRLPGLEMPVFDQLKSESVLFSNVTPAGYFTQRVLPALFLGRIVKDIRSDLRGNLFVEFAAQSGWHRFDPNATIFADAHRLGWSDGLVGWSNPYCRILPGVLDYCYWDAEDDTPQYTALHCALAPFAAQMSVFRPKLGMLEREHERNLIEIMAQAGKLIQNENIHLVFIHLPVPHPPGIFDRTTGRMRDAGSYIDNLALADRSLGELIATLKATPDWSRTTLIVSSDHSWRVPMWRNAPGWTKEEETASQGKFDPRPMLMIRFPEQSEAVQIAQPFQGIEIHSILEEMLQGKLQSPAELQSWLHDTSNTGPNQLQTSKPSNGN